MAKFGSDYVDNNVKKYLRLTDDAPSATFVLLDGGMTARTYYDSRENKFYRTDDPHKEGSSVKFAVNVYIPETREVMIFSGPSSLLKEIAAVGAEIGRDVVSVAKRGNGKNTRYIATRIGTCADAPPPAHDLNDAFRYAPGHFPLKDSNDEIPF